MIFIWGPNFLGTKKVRGSMILGGHFSCSHLFPSLQTVQIFSLNCMGFVLQNKIECKIDSCFPTSIFQKLRSILTNLNFCVRSIGSESSVSLSSDTNFPSPSALRRINEGPSQPQVTASAAHQPPPQTASNSPKQAKKTAIQSRLASPKRSPKLQRGKFQTKLDLLYAH